MKKLKLNKEKISLKFIFLLSVGAIIYATINILINLVYYNTFDAYHLIQIIFCTFVLYILKKRHKISFDSFYIKK